MALSYTPFNKKVVSAVKYEYITVKEAPFTVVLINNNSEGNRAVTFYKYMKPTVGLSMVILLPTVIKTCQIFMH
jgi:hypothetical protein